MVSLLHRLSSRWFKRNFNIFTYSRSQSGSHHYHHILNLQAHSNHQIMEDEEKNKVDNDDATVGSDPKTAVESVKNLSNRAFKRLKRKEKRLQEKLAADGNCLNEEFVKIKKSKFEEALGRKKLMDLITDEILNETDCYYENKMGLRKVYPYYYNFTSYAKGRWYGKKLIDVFVKEFQNYSYDKCKSCIEKGTLRVEKKKINVDYVIENGDIIVNRVHRHELPVTDQKIDLIANTEDLLVVNKPASIPIHPCGRYRHNSLQYMLAKDHGFRNLRVLYRIDRLTSGLVILAKTEEKTREIMEHIKNRLMKKVYICKVEGDFPSEVIECNKPIDVLSEKMGIYTVSEGGKESHTTFKCLSTDGKTSILKCEPKTGRTHQIRVHLQYLGYPIVNDPFYNDDVWGTEKGKNGNFGKSREQLIADLSNLHKSNLHIVTDDRSTIVSNKGNYDLVNDDSCDDGLGHTVAKKSRIEIHDSNKNFNGSDVTTQCRNNDGQMLSCEKESAEKNGPTYDDINKYYEETCSECAVRCRDPTPDQLYICLHAFSYQGPDWKYSTALPQWAVNINIDDL